jgi:PASTA domain
VWVGYPDTLRPMLTDFHGQPVAGGTFPAEIWHDFVSSEKGDGSSFESPPYLGSSSAWVVKRGGEWMLDNGYCKGARQVAYFSGKAPQKEADCKPNEVSVPLVLGLTAEGAANRLAAQPLAANVVYKPAKPGKAPGIVVDQFPRNGGLSANDEVTVVVTKARWGILPNFVGSSLEDAGRAARRLKLDMKAETAPGRRGVVLRQSPKPGVAVGPGLSVTLVVGDGSRKPNS